MALRFKWKDLKENVSNRRMLNDCKLPLTERNLDFFNGPKKFSKTDEYDDIGSESSAGAIDKITTRAIDSCERWLQGFKEHDGSHNQDLKVIIPPSLKRLDTPLSDIKAPSFSSWYTRDTRDTFVAPSP